MFTLNTQEKQYLSDAMGKVSRSFALVVALLEEPLDLFMTTAYLICRVADNIEDSLRPLAWQQQRFGELERLLRDPAVAPDILAVWSQEKWPGLTTDEQALMGTVGGMQLWRIYGALPEAPQQVIRDWVLVMIQGMAQKDGVVSPPRTVQRNGIHLLASEQDYNRYCYFVAGTVGHLGTELVVAHYGVSADVARRLYESCESCGRGLQKTNIIKDFGKDLRRQVCYLPDTWLQEAQYAPLLLDGAPREWTQHVIHDAQRELHNALDHVLNIPLDAVGYRKASLICLLPGLQTLLMAAQHAERLFTPRHHVKISRETMMECLQMADWLWEDNDAIVPYCEAIEQAINTSLLRSANGAQATVVPSMRNGDQFRPASEPQG